MWRIDLTLPGREGRSKTNATNAGSPLIDCSLSYAIVAPPLMRAPMGARHPGDPAVGAPAPHGA
jgi:hypothetical protein